MTWIHDPIPDAWVLVDPPQVDHMRLYTLIPSVSGSIADWAADLKRIRDMGFNTVHLLPLTVLDTSQSPYSARELFDIDPMYGGCRLVSERSGPARELCRGRKSIGNATLLRPGAESRRR